MIAKSNLSTGAWISIGCGTTSIVYTLWAGMFVWRPESWETGLEALAMVPALLLSSVALPIALIQARYRVWPPLWVAILSSIAILIVFGIDGFYALF